MVDKKPNDSDWRYNDDRPGGTLPPARRLPQKVPKRKRRIRWSKQTANFCKDLVCVITALALVAGTLAVLIESLWAVWLALRKH